MDEHAGSERDAIPTQPRTVGRATVPGLTPVHPDEPLPQPKAATTYTAARPVDDDADVVDEAPRIPAPRSSDSGLEPVLGVDLPAALRGVSEPLPRRRARSVNEFTDGPDPSSGGTPWSPFGNDEQPPPPDPSAYRVRATARVPGYLPEMNAPSVDADREDRILPDGPLVNELFFDGPPVNRPEPEPASAADYAAALMRQWSAEEVPPPAADPIPADLPESALGTAQSPHSSWSTPVEWDADPAGFGVNSGRARNVQIETIGDPDDPEPAGFEAVAWPKSDDVAEPVAPETRVADPVMPRPVAVEPEVSDSGHATPAEPAPAPAGLLGLFGDSFDDLSFDRIPFERDEPSPGTEEPQPAVDAPTPDLAALYGAAPTGESAAVVDSYWGSTPGPDLPASPRSWSDRFAADPPPVESTPFDSLRVESLRVESLPVESPPAQTAPVAPPIRATAGIDGAVVARASVPGYLPQPIQPSTDAPVEPPPAATGLADPADFGSANAWSTSVESTSVEWGYAAMGGVEPAVVEPGYTGRDFDWTSRDHSRDHEPGFNESGFSSPSSNVPGYRDTGFEDLGRYQPGLDDRPGISASGFDEPSPDEPGPREASADLPGGSFWGEPDPEPAPDIDIPDVPVIGTVRAAVRVPGLLIERPPVDISDEDRPLAVPVAVERPAAPEPAPLADVAADAGVDAPIVTYAPDDWRRNVRGAATVSSEAGGTVYVADVEDGEDEPISTTQKLLRSGVIALLVVIFIVAFRYGPNIDEWLHS